MINVSDNKQLKDVLKKLTDDVTCKDCEHFLGMGDWNLCCTETSDLCYKDTPVCEKFKQAQ